MASQWEPSWDLGTPTFFSQCNESKSHLYRRFLDDCVGVTSPSKEGLNQFTNDSVNSFHPALKYIRKITENSLAFLEIKFSINNNGLSTSVHYTLTDSHTSSHPQHIKNSIPFHQFLRLKRLCGQHRKTPRSRDQSRNSATYVAEKGEEHTNPVRPHLPTTQLHS